jgi:thymidylate synthase (FAD)
MGIAMKLVEPKVYLIAETGINYQELKAALKDIGGDIATAWLKGHAKYGMFGGGESYDEVNDGEFLIEVAGRTCYKSYGVGLNPNITKIRQEAKEYLENTLAKGDGSIFEHSTVTLLLTNISRVFTHELVRHRVGVAISQESGRYVRIDQTNPMGLWLPDLSKFEKYRKHKIKVTTNAYLQESARLAEERYLKLQEDFNWAAMEMNEKKELTSALRRPLPNGQANNITWTANHRTLRHVLVMRTSEFAEIEIRMVFDKIGQLLVKKFPLIYQDFERTPLPDGTGVWKPKYVKV